jgi:hypothetical protein
MTPINYTAMQVNPADALMQGVKTGMTLDAAAAEKQQQQLALQAQQQAQQGQRALQMVLSNPNATVQDYGAVAAINPKFRETIKEHWDRLDSTKQQSAIGDFSKLFSALQSGRPDIALDSIETQLKAAENSGDKPRADQIKVYRDMIREAPDYARTMIGASIAAIPGGDKYFTSIKTMGEEKRAGEQAPAELAKKNADATKAMIEARYTDPKIQGEIADTLSKISERSGRLGLDREKFNLDFDTTLEKLKKGQGAPELSPGMEKLQAESVGNSITSRTASDRASGLAEALVAEQNAVGGRPLRWLAENAKKITGSEDGYTALRQDYVRIRNQGLLTDLPPGPASDKDIALMKDGFPSENQSPDYIAKWLKSYANVQKAIAQKEDAKAEWISGVGSLRTAPKDITIGTVSVPAGTSFTEFIQRTQNAAPKVKNATGYMDFGR